MQHTKLLIPTSNGLLEQLGLADEWGWEYLFAVLSANFLWLDYSTANVLFTFKMKALVLLSTLCLFTGKLIHYIWNDTCNADEYHSLSQCELVSVTETTVLHCTIVHYTRTVSLLQCWSVVIVCQYVMIDLNLIEFVLPSYLSRYWMVTKFMTLWLWRSCGKEHWY